MAFELIHLIRAIYLGIIGIIFIIKPKSVFKFGMWLRRDLLKIKIREIYSPTPFKVLGFILIILGIISAVFAFI